MNIDLDNTEFVSIENVNIPDAFYRRFKTNVEVVDTLFGGNGFLPGSTFTLAGGHGSGKSTFLLQICSLVAQQGKNVAYISGEESIVQISFNSKRLNVSNIKVSNLKDVDEICNQIVKNNFDFVIIDSFPTLTVKKKLTSKKKEEYIVQRLCSTAKKNDIVIGIIQHVTKSGNYKGSTVLPHSVDITIKMQRNEDDPDNINSRDIIATKNRFGSTAFVSINMKERGFDFFEASRPEKKDPLHNIKSISLQEATKLFGSYYNAKKYLEKSGFIKKDRGLFVKN